MSEEDNVRFVRALWAVIGDGGLEAALELTEPDVEWRPHAAGGRVLTSEELLEFFKTFQGERQLLEATPYSFEAHGDLVLASGSFRLRGSERMAEFQIHFVYEFDDGRLVRSTTYATRREAAAAIGLANGNRS
jgi:ketosteroid isomerase-like protein